MKKLLVVIILLLVALLLVMTRPSKEKHMEAMMKAVKEYVDEEADNHGFGDNVLTRLGKTVVTKAIETALNSKIKFNEYYLFNTTSVHLDDGDQTLSLGIVGQVFTFDKEKLREKLEEASRTKEVERVERAAAKEEARQLKEQLREQRKLERKQRKEARRLEREAAKAAAKAEKAAAKEKKRQEKEARKRASQKE
jgi:chromosome segregation ATPase